jgi:Fe-S cluster biosynthesis and repair protein YggX
METMKYDKELVKRIHYLYSKDEFIKWVMKYSNLLDGKEVEQLNSDMRALTGAEFQLNRAVVIYVSPVDRYDIKKEYFLN